ncbi:MAG: hypothetical protein GY798_14760 [Hyphomicrobiales bacterium]|nr:hypothetical protein [Hyphomicrobiales bacterium]
MFWNHVARQARLDHYAATKVCGMPRRPPKRLAAADKSVTWLQLVSAVFLIGLVVPVTAPRAQSDSSADAIAQYRALITKRLAGERDKYCDPAFLKTQTPDQIDAIIADSAAQLLEAKRNLVSLRLRGAVDAANLTAGLSKEIAVSPRARQALGIVPTTLKGMGRLATLSIAVGSDLVLDWYFEEEVNTLFAAYGNHDEPVTPAQVDRGAQIASGIQGSVLLLGGMVTAVFNDVKPASNEDLVKWMERTLPDGFMLANAGFASDLGTLVTLYTEQIPRALAKFEPTEAHHTALVECIEKWRRSDQGDGPSGLFADPLTREPSVSEARGTFRVNLTTGASQDYPCEISLNINASNLVTGTLTTERSSYQINGVLNDADVLRAEVIFRHRSGDPERNLFFDMDGSLAFDQVSSRYEGQGTFSVSNPDVAGRWHDEIDTFERLDGRQSGPGGRSTTASPGAWR